MPYEPLAPCPSCARHVKTTETACPFCKGVLGADLAAGVVPAAASRLTRAAAYAFTASLAVAACTGGGGDLPNDSDGGSSGSSGSSGGKPDSGPADDGGGQALYGAPAYGQPAPEDAGPDDSGGGGAKYGGPPIDGG